MGSVLDMGEPLSSESEMSALLVTEPHQWSTAPRFEADERQIVVLEAHPIYPSERTRARSGERERFQDHLRGATYDPRRPEITFR